MVNSIFQTNCHLKKTYTNWQYNKEHTPYRPKESIDCSNDQDDKKTICLNVSLRSSRTHNIKEENKSNPNYSKHAQKRNKPLKVFSKLFIQNSIQSSSVGPFGAYIPIIQINVMKDLEREHVFNAQLVIQRNSNPEPSVQFVCLSTTTSNEVNQCLDLFVCLFAVQSARWEGTIHSHYCLSSRSSSSSLAYNVTRPEMVMQPCEANTVIVGNINVASDRALPRGFNFSFAIARDLGRTSQPIIITRRPDRRVHKQSSSAQIRRSSRRMTKRERGR